MNTDEQQTLQRLQGNTKRATQKIQKQIKETSRAKRKLDERSPGETNQVKLTKKKLRRCKRRLSQYSSYPAQQTQDKFKLGASHGPGLTNGISNNKIQTPR